VRIPFVQNERAIGQIRQVGFVTPLALRSGVEPLIVQTCIDLIGSGGAAVTTAPELDESTVVVVATESARAMAGRECRRLVQEEQLGESARLE
jgi:hypothetical protein